ncbi:UDP-N-acetylmuramoylalanyl-D-glutamyl-2,6-diaminopimelate--D-alanyl-D-alanine ligase [Martelella alba]|uniref:UDP-N-acetylmuramoyl-tripeptide--D-alanyl-D-alanine ligase n=1 Tax=Martelella alba TaxID=2590451 RepID=A0A506UJT4_9HYPH|nr:UDP-N-acetylmuramoylalanyl-D-glutamyl-2,6-diaminopimelate--D-alanyl-D-alanine ligase [Martelella alba]TPW33594.1 UDP-N-acetylmuramoylalanyl-D-glutamyl-2,6-diaminopimelate--D-alanyl-D-alanine ligase [Martelella alba]
MSLLWTSSEMVEAMDGRPVGNLPEGVDGISIDSRNITPGDAFFAIKGDRVDGHSFAGFAAANGAGLLVVSEAKLPALGRLTCPMIVVDDVLEAMVMLASASRARCKGRIIAVTGSVGKTSTKEMIAGCLRPSGNVHAAVKSFNNHWGVPLTLARMRADTDFGVFEIGMNHAGEISPLSRLVRPHIAVITTIAPVHIGHFNSIAEIAAAKAEIFDGLEPEGHAILNRDIEQFEGLSRAARAAGAEVIGFGEHAKASFRLLDYRLTGEIGHVQALLDSDEPVSFELAIPGQHMAENALAALAAVSVAGGEMDAAIETLGQAEQLSGRGKRHRLKISGGGFMLIDESYNANPASMRAALELLGAAEPAEGGHRIAVLGDMLELGAYAPAAHEALAAPLVSAGVTHVFLAGREMLALKEALPDSMVVEYREKTEDLLPLVVSSVGVNDIVMIKSSLGIGFGSIVKTMLETYPAL